MLRWLVGSLAVLTLTSLVTARDGTVVTKDGQTYQGEVTEKGDSIEIVSPGVTGPIGIKKANVQSVQYVDETSAAVKAALGKLEKRDVKSRIALAHQAIDGRAYEVARAALDEAQAIEPNNREVADLLVQVSRHLAPASQPSTPAPPAGDPAAPGPATKPAAGEVFVAKREVTPEEINRIRQIEWRKDEPLPMKVRVDRDVVKTFFTTYTEMTRAEFAKLPPDQQGLLILSKGKADLRAGVHVENDPVSIFEYRKNVHHVIVQGCAAAGCHSAGKAGTFNLFAANNDAAIYTNYLILQKYSKTIAPKAGDRGKPTQRMVVDREYPDQSLLLQYMLPPSAADTPHPAVPGYKGVVKLASAAAYAQTAHWIKQLNPIAPDYEIDLSQDPPKKEPKESKGDAKGG
ncbi:MAG: hypothetical protein JWN51_2304 [Phycisphaerales bacterium]|nr:hypothetical protein [Phycisphaerales bacterium]